MYRNRDLMRVLDQTRKETDMKKISLNDIDKSRNNDNGEWELGRRVMPEYVLRLIAYKVLNEKRKGAFNHEIS